MGRFLTSSTSVGDPQTLPSRPRRQSSPGSVRPSSLDVATYSLVDVVLTTSKTTPNGCRKMQPQLSPIVRTVSNPPTPLPLKPLHLCRNPPWPPPCPTLRRPPSQLRPPRNLLHHKVLPQYLPLRRPSPLLRILALKFHQRSPRETPPHLWQSTQLLFHPPRIPLTPLLAVPPPVGPPLQGPLPPQPRIG